MSNSSSPTSKGVNWPLIALGIATFGIGTTEFAPMGLLPAIADGIDLSIPTAGTLITAYAVGVMIGAPVMTLLLDRISKKTALLILMAIFVLGNVLSAVAPGYVSLLIARVITSLCQGAFFGLGAVVASSLVPKEKQASAVAVMFLGSSIANIGGVPAATWIGQYLDWRMAFAGIAILGVIAIASLFRALPKDENTSHTDVKGELAALANMDVVLAISTTVIFASSLFTIYTYVAPLLERETGASTDFVTLCLMLLGIGFTLGNWIGGKLADWSLDGATAIALTGMGLVSMIVAFLMGTHLSAALILFLWAAVAFCVVPALQVRAMREAEGAPGLGSAVNMAGFNLGNAIGASVGGIILDAGFGYDAIPVAAGLIALCGVFLVWVRRRRHHKISLQAA